jgi:hypothetical protein
MPVARKLLKMVGTAEWCALSDDFRGQVMRAIVRDGKELVLDIDWAGQRYDVKLQRIAGDRFEGSWSYRGDRAPSGSISATLYTSSEGKLLLGEWSEDNARYHWWADLTVVPHFPDEKR